MEIKPSNRIWLVALVAAWIFDLVFYAHNAGISILLYIALLILAGLWLARSHAAGVARWSWPLVGAALVFAALTLFRREPFTLFYNVLLALFSLGLLALTLRSGVWPRYALVDYVVAAFRLIAAALGKPVTYFNQMQRLSAQAREEGGKKTAASSAGPVVRGVLLAVPVVVVLGILLSSADPIFSDTLKNMFAWLKIDNLPEYFLRGMYIAVMAYVLTGVFYHSTYESGSDKLIGLEKPVIAPFLGLTEAGIVLASVDVLFAVFVAVQFRYFFGGGANINTSGYTYAEYAVRGFGELVAVAVISLLLFLGLSAITRRQTSRGSRIFSGLGIALVALVAVILVSAFQRLVLYESAYGFTRLRAMTHIFMIWLGVLLLATIVLELARRLRYFALALLLVSLGFGLTLNALNIDAFIVRQNVVRAQQGHEFDSGYLLTLSSDSVPALVEQFKASGVNPELKDELGGLLACRADSNNARQTPQSWVSFEFSGWQEQKLLKENETALQAYPVRTNATGTQQVQVNGVWQDCWSYERMD